MSDVATSGGADFGAEENDSEEISKKGGDVISYELRVRLERISAEQEGKIKEILLANLLGAMNQVYRIMDVFKTLSQIWKLVNIQYIEETEHRELLLLFAMICGAPMVKQLLDEGFLGSKEVIQRPMQTPQQWLQTVQKRGLLEEDVLVVVLTTIDFLEMWAQYKKKYPHRKPDDEGVWYDIWAVVQFGNYVTTEGDKYGANPITTALFGTRHLGIRFFAREIKGSITDPVLKLALEASTAVLYTNVAGIAIALMASFSEVSEKALVMTTKWEKTDDGGGHLGTFEPARYWVDKAGNFTFQEWIKVEIDGEGGKRYVCLPLLFRTIRYKWMSLNMKTRNTARGQIGKNCTEDIARNGDMLPRFANTKFVENLNTNVVYQMTLIPTHCKPDILIRFFTALSRVITVHSESLDICNEYYDVLRNMDALLKTKWCGVAVLTWYLEIRYRFDTELNSYVYPTHCSRKDIDSLIEAGVSDTGNPNAATTVPFNELVTLAAAAIDAAELVPFDAVMNVFLVVK